MSGKKRVVQYLVPVGLSAPVEQQVDAVVALAEECRKEEDEQAQRGTTYEKPYVRLVLETSEDALGKAHRADEIEAHQSAEHTEQQTGGNALHRPLVIKMESEKRCVTTKYIGKAGGGDTADEDG